MTGWTVFFDGECAFCSKSIRWVAHRDPRNRISFAPLQGELAQERGLSACAAKDEGTMVVIRESDGHVFTHSDAWIETAIAMGGRWSWLKMAKIVPKPVRDRVYRWVAKNRYRFAKPVDACELPDQEVVNRLIQ